MFDELHLLDKEHKKIKRKDPKTSKQITTQLNLLNNQLSKVQTLERIKITKKV